MEKSNLLISELILAGIIQPTDSEISNARAIIRIHLNNTFRDGVVKQRMASNKKIYVEPVYED